jgi:20S proteasome alpha/beta subunit
MTILIGIKCKDGIIIGSDSSATFSSGQIRTIEQSTKKIEIIDDKIIIAGTGQIGLGQRFCNQVNQGWRNGHFKSLNGVGMATKMCQLALEDFRNTYVQPGEYGALVAFHADHSLHLCEFPPNDFQPELKTESIWYASMGSGQMIADPFLGLMRKIFWDDGMPTLQDGIFIATWALQHAIDVNPGGVNGPIQLALLKKDEKNNAVAKMLLDDELNEHLQNVEGVIEHLRKYKDILAGNCTKEAPEIPKNT